MDEGLPVVPGAGAQRSGCAAPASDALSPVLSPHARRKLQKAQLQHLPARMDDPGCDDALTQASMPALPVRGKPPQSVALLGCSVSDCFERPGPGLRADSRRAQAELPRSR